MPSDREQTPSTVQRSPQKVRAAYEKTLDSAEQTYRGDEERAHRAAWSSVKHIAEKRGDHWELKDEPGPSDLRSANPPAAKRRGEGETYGGVDVRGNTRDELLQRAKRAGVVGYSHMNKRELAKALARAE